MNILEFDIPFRVTSYMQEPVREVVERVHPIIREELEGSLNHQKELNRVHSITRETIQEGSLNHQKAQEGSLGHQRRT